MSINKTYISKERILNNISNPKNIYRFLKSETLIMDDWSKKFYNNLCNFNNYQSIRTRIINGENITTNEIKKLMYKSNILINLKNDPTWTDIVLCTKITGIDISDNFNDMLEKNINKLIDG